MLGYKKTAIELHCWPSCIEKKLSLYLCGLVNQALCMLITCKILHSKDAQSKTVESPLEHKTLIISQLNKKYLLCCLIISQDDRTAS